MVSLRDEVKPLLLVIFSGLTKSEIRESKDFSKVIMIRNGVFGGPGMWRTLSRVIWSALSSLPSACCLHLVQPLQVSGLAAGCARGLHQACIHPRLRCLHRLIPSPLQPAGLLNFAQAQLLTPTRPFLVLKTDSIVVTGPNRPGLGRPSPLPITQAQCTV
jgi:hypothetical protein